MNDIFKENVSNGGTTMNGIIKCPKCGQNMMVSKHVNDDNTQDVVCLKCGYRTKKQVI